MWVLGPLGFGVVLSDVAASTFLYIDIVAKALFGFVAPTSSRSLARLDDGASGDVVGAVGPTAVVDAD